MKVDVVIVAFGDPAELADCLDTVIGDEAVAGITVVDNGDGRSAALARARAVGAVHRPDNPGFGAAVNAGAQEGDAEAILVLNPDARLDPAGLRACLDRLQADPRVGAVQGAIVNATTRTEERSSGRELGVLHLAGRLLHLRTLLRSSRVRSLTSRSAILRDHVDRRPGAPTEVATLAATAVVVRRDAFVSVRGFDERYFLYGEDLDLCARLRATGWVLEAVPDTMAVHRSGGSSRSAWDRELVWWEGTLRFARDHWRGARRLAACGLGWCQGAVLTVRRPARARTVFAAIGGRR